MKKLLIIALCLPLCGCARWLVPQTTISGTVNGQPFTIKTPKNSSFDKLSASVVNSNLTLTITNFKAYMDPAIVQMSGQTFIDSINAIGTQVSNGIGQAAGTAVKP